MRIINIESKLKELIETKQDNIQELRPAINFSRRRVGNHDGFIFQIASCIICLTISLGGAFSSIILLPDFWIHNWIFSYLTWDIEIHYFQFFLQSTYSICQCTCSYTVKLHQVRTHKYGSEKSCQWTNKVYWLTETTRKYLAIMFLKKSVNNFL